MIDAGYYSINLSRWSEECQICYKWMFLTHCVPFYEEPRPDLEIGQRLSNGDEVGGMSCCKECHDKIHYKAEVKR